MSQTLCFDISLGSSKTGLTLNGQLVDSTGANSGSAITTGFVEIGDGCYLLTSTVADDFVGIVKVYESGQTEILAIGSATDPQTVAQAGAAAAIVAYNLDHLAKTATAAADMTTEVTDGTIISRMLSKTSDTSTYDPTTEAAEALRDRGDVAWITATSVVVSDKTGFSLSATGLDLLSAAEPTAKPTTFSGWLMWLVQKARRSTMTATTLTVKTEAGVNVTTQTVSDDGTVQSLGPPI